MIPGSANPLLLASAAAAGGYQIERSLRFNSSDSAYLSRTPAVAGNRTTFTFSCWVKLSTFGSDQTIFAGWDGSAGNQFEIRLQSDSTFFLNTGGDSGNRTIATTSAVFRDPSAWYHLVCAVDTTQASASNHFKFYINNSLQTLSLTASGPQNLTTQINGTFLHHVGVARALARYFNGYLADIHFIDGQALTPSSFTEVSATTGQLIPKAYAGTYTGNSFWLKFNDNSAATATTLGKDSFLLGNNWTPNNLSVTAGAGNDSLVDTPTSNGTDTGVGNEVRGNYATLNPLKMGSFTLSNGNLDCVSTSSYALVLGTIGMSSGKWYFETTLNGSGAANSIGIATDAVTVTQYPGYDSLSWTYLADGRKINGGSRTSYGASFTTGDVIGIAFDADAGSLTFYKNGTSQGTAFTSLTSGPYFPCVGDDSSGSQAEQSLNFGQRAFAYQTPGTNRPAATFKALCDTNLPAPVVAKPSTVFDVITYTGTGSSLTLPNGSSTPTSISFTPDFAWLKGRSGATDHALYDAVRGVQKDLVSNSTSAETTETTGLTAFGTNTFTVGSLAKLNTSSSTYVTWAWNAGGTTDPSNQAGSITSQVRANASAGFSIVGFNSGSAGNYTVGHGLGVKPQFIITKARNGSTFNWAINHVSIATTLNKYLTFTTSATSDNGSATWGASLADTNSTTFGISSANAVEASKDCIAYCFAPVVGYSSFGSYQGNGSASNGPFVYTGFRPRFIMIKRTDSTLSANWYMYDTARDTYNLASRTIEANLSAAENQTKTSYYIDVLSNGFKVRADTEGLNDAAPSVYIYCAWAESPFQYARAR